MKRKGIDKAQWAQEKGTTDFIWNLTLIIMALFVAFMIFGSTLSPTGTSRDWLVAGRTLFLIAIGLFGLMLAVSLAGKPPGNSSVWAQIRWVIRRFFLYAVLPVILIIVFLVCFVAVAVHFS